MGGGWEPEKFPGTVRGGEPSEPGVRGLRGLGGGGLGVPGIPSQGVLGGSEGVGTLMAPLREVQGLMQDLGLPVSHLRRFLGGHCGVEAPQHPTSAGLVGSEQQLRALPVHLGKVWGILGGPRYLLLGVSRTREPWEGGRALG